MKNTMKKLLGLGLVAAMTCSLFACGSTTTDSGDTADTSAASSDEDQVVADIEVEDTGFTADNTYTIGYNYYGPGSYALETLAGNQKYVIEAFGSTAQDVSDNFQVEQIITDVENMISAGCDGLVIWLPADALYPTVIQMCDEAQVPYVFADKVPSDPDVIALLEASDYFAGAVGPANAEYGTIIADYAIEQGYTSCIISTGATGDPTDTPRIEAFTAEFEANGGKVETIIYSDSNDLIQQNTENGLIAYPDVDFVYGTGSDYAIGGADAIQAQGLDTKVLTSGLDSAVLAYLVDESNPVEFVNGDYWISGTMATVALMNYLDGNPLKDADGKMVFVDDIMPFNVTADNYDDFVATFIDSPCFSTEEIQAMNGHYNADFDYDAFIQVIEDYSLDSRIAAHAN